MERDKLKDLLGEYIDSIGQQERWEIKTEEIISKKFGFIKWLVENDKIDNDKYEIKYNILFEKYTSFYENLLMLLAIQDKPIEFLISILKNV